MISGPSDIKAIRKERVLQLTWPEGQVTRYGFKRLRGECRCAGCIDERTGIRTLDVRTIPEDIEIRALELVGNYAIKITWSDGHDTGLYAWDHLRRIAINSDAH
ncbi:MAG TPA: DUF971 domain-containing protein [Phycisphaerae bacterium]